MIAKSYSIFKGAALWVFYLLTFTAEVNAQLNSLNSSYFLNRYQVNPSYAGFQEGLKVNLDYRKQWSNIPGSPNTQSITADYNLNRVGIGINVLNETAGSLQRTKAMATYAYHLPLSDEGHYWRFGASVGIVDECVNYSRINGDVSDLTLADFNERRALFDVDFGMAYTGKRLSIEAAVPNLRSIKEKHNDVDRSRFYLALSYKFSAGTGINSLEIEPRVSYRNVKGYNSLVDVGTNLIFSDELWIMGIYHSNKSASFGAGINYKSSLTIMVFYTTETSALQGTASGTFEIALSARVSKNRRNR